MTEQTLNTGNTETLDLGLDLQNVSDDPTNALGVFNLEQLEQSQTSGPGPKDPPVNKPVTMADLNKRYEMRTQKLKYLAEVGIPKMADETRNRLQTARVVEFDAKKNNLDRYLGYGKSTFNKVGFVPYVDNEKAFNENTTIWQDFGRMSSVFGSLMYEGGVSGYRSMVGLIKGDDTFSPDDETAENFARLQNIGMSSKGGIGGFTNNFLLNSAYTVGVGMSILAEEAALFAATALTEGAMSGVAAMRTAANVGRFGRTLKQAFNTNAVGNVFQGGVQLAKSFSKVGDAKDFYNSVKSGSYLLGKGTLQFFNPLTRTTDDVLDIMRGSSSVKNMSNLAKAKKTFGSFYRDARDMNLALSESKLEGGSARIDKLNELLDKYERENGKPAEGKDLERIYQQAEDTGYGVTAFNFPTIYMTNRVVLDGVFKFRGFKTLEEAAELSQKGIGFKKGVGFFDTLSGSWLKDTAKSLTNPKAYIGKGVGYFRRNFAEGIQENLQNVTSDAVSAYYDGVYKDPALGGFDYGVGHTLNALKYEATSMRGFETFASGFLMGGLMGKGQNLFLRDVPGIYYRVAQPKKYAEYVANRKETRQNAVNALNELYSNPLRYFSSRNESASTQKHTSDVMNQADEAGDAKTFQDSKDLKMFDHIFTALDNGTYSTLLGSYKELSKLDNKDLADFLGVQDASRAPEKLQEVIGRAEEIKQRYDAVSQQFKNPFTPDKLKRGTPEFTKEAIAFRAFESAKKTAVAAQYGFDRALQRMNSLYGELSADRPVSKASSSDIAVLTDINGLDSEISLLEQEVNSYAQATDPRQKEIGKQKNERLERLMDFRDKLRTHLESRGNVEREEDGQIVIEFPEATVDPLKESYKSYLRHISAVNNDYVLDDKIESSFEKLLDYYQLDADAKNYNQVVNTLLDPLNFYRHSERLNNTFTELFQNRNSDINTRIERAQRAMEISELIKALAAQGVMLDPQELQEFVRSGKRPTTYIDAATLQNLSPSSVKYKAAEAILEIDRNIQEQPEQAQTTETTPEQAPAAQATETQQTEEQQPVIDAGIEPELEVKLRDAYNQYVEEYESDMTFEDFVANTRTAARIKSQFRKQTQQQPAATTQEQAAAQDDDKSTPTIVIPDEQISTGTESRPGESITLVIPSEEAAPVSNADSIEKRRREEVLAAIPTDEDLVINPEQFDRYDREGNSAPEGTLSGKDIEYNIQNELERNKKDNANLTGRFKLENARYYRQRIPKLEEILAKVKEINAKYDGLEGAAPAETEQTQEAAPVPKPSGIANPKVILTGTKNGWQNFGSNNYDLLNDGLIVDMRGRESQFGSDGILTENEKNGDTIVHYKIEASDAFGRPGYFMVSVVAKPGQTVDPQGLKKVADEAVQAIVKKKDSAGFVRLEDFNQTDFDAIKNAVVSYLKEPQAEPQKVTEPVATPVEKTGAEKARELIDSVSSIKDLPDLNKADSRPVTIDLIELISTGQAKAKDVVTLIANKRKELLQKISTKDLQKGDILTFTDGRRGFVKSVANNQITVKVVGSPQGATEVVKAADLSSTISNIESAKAVSMEPTPDIEITPQEEKEVKASQDAKTSFTENSAAVKEVGEKAAKAAGKDNQENLNNLFKNIGCKTGK